MGSPFLVLPDVTDVGYIVDLWHEAGTVESTGMGIKSLSWPTVESWMNVRERLGHPPLLDYEVNLVTQMSEAYSSEYSQASDTTRPAPYTAEDIASSIDRVAVGNKLKSIFSTFGKNDAPRYEIEPN